MFHGFTDRDHEGLENCDHKHLRADKFEQFLRLLRRSYHPISLTKLLEAWNAGRELPPNPVVLTFDDGYQSNHRLALPLLVRYEVPASVYLATEFVDEKRALWPDRVEFAFHHTPRQELGFSCGGSVVKLPLATLPERLRALIAVKKALKHLPQEGVHDEVRRLEEYLDAALPPTGAAAPDIYRSLDWNQVSEMAASGLVEIGNHTHRHRILGRCAPETMREELETASRAIAAHAGAAPKLFCYPNGGQGDFSPQSEEILRGMHFSCALTTLRGFNAPGANPFELRRFGVSNQWDTAAFDLHVSGLISLLGRHN
jgi:peptidoglycan/xylan/chitin deacetylase (PgdA/CDA1 family)